ncbi:uncharacterized protein HGUI_01673 [Hanseniaspora guilliermondii]|uniref:VASt domain-containing protein n=1 Tax=Hanseniaspora guilliermondii TaxID=56406 RepID=A0A1L0CM29_9ASCO|nr:uncharacterized protein HGUI_01673 [Hanseniaspora guilliermondii]
MVSTHSDTSRSSGRPTKEKLMHNFISAIEHLLPIENDKSNEHHYQSMDNNMNSLPKSNSFLDNLNSILQPNNPQHSSNADEATQTETPKKFNVPEVNFQNYSSRKSIFSDTEFELNHDTRTAYTNNDSSSTKDNSVKSIGFQHIQKPSLDYDSEDDIGEIQEENDPDLQLTDDYIINPQREKTDIASFDSPVPNFKRSTPQRAVSDVPRRTLTMYEPGTKSSGSFNEQKPKSPRIRLKPYNSSSQNSDNNEKYITKHKRSGTISLAPLGMTKLKNRLRAESISKQDILDGNLRSRNNSSNCLVALNRTRSDAPTIDSGKTSKNEKESLSTDSAESKLSFKEEVFSCALQKDILIQGKLYLNFDNLHFKSKIFGIKTEIEVNIKDIVQLEKKTTAILFPNGIVVKTLDKTYTFASFLNRDSVFEKIMKRWSDSIISGISEKPTEKNSKPTLQSKPSLNRSKNISFKLPEIFDSEGDALRLKNPVKKMIHGIVDSSSENEDYENSSDRIDTDQSEDGSVDESDDDMTSDDVYEESDEPNPSDSSNSSNNDFGPNKGTNYEPDLKSYANDTDIADYTLQNTTLGKVFKIMSDKMYELLEKGGNNTISDVPKIYPEDDNGERLADGQYKREYTYVKPLNSSLGPKETKCLVKDVLEKVDLSKYFIINQITETPDVPSGKSFHVITNMIFYWIGEDTVKMRAFTRVVWTGKSWIKGPVESGNSAGQKSSMKSLVEAIQSINDSNNEKVNTGVSNGKSKKKAKNKKPKKSYSKSEAKIDDEEQQGKVKSEPQDKWTFTQNIPSFPVISQYLTWLIIIYLVIDRYKTYSLVSKQLQIQQNNTKTESQISENEIWDWVFKRSTKDKFNYERLVYSKSENQSELAKFDKQELYILKQLKQKELDVLNDMLI